MHLIGFLFILWTCCGAANVECQPSRHLWVNKAPQNVRPYALEKFKGETLLLGNHAYRFSVTANSSDGAFSIVQNSSPMSSSLRTLPHYHRVYFENFYCIKGAFQFWAQPATNTHQESRVLTQGDFAAIHPGATHTYKVLYPDSQLTGVTAPAGIELALQAATSNPLRFDSVIGAAFSPNDLLVTPQNDPAVIATLAAYDVFPAANFTPRADLVNGIAGAPGSNWHNRSNQLSTDAESFYFVAQNRGLKYLNSDDGIYRIIEPVVTPLQSHGTLSMGTITMARLLSNQSAPIIILVEPTAMQVIEGRLVVEVEGFEAATLIQGDVVFIPAGLGWKYYATAAFTKFLYVTRGTEKGNLVFDLLQNSVNRKFASYPQYPRE